MNYVSVAIDGPVATITMDDGKANALSKDVINQVNSSLDAVEANDEVKAIVLAGREGRFSGGFDLNVMRGGDFKEIVNLVADGGALVRRLYGGPKPVVAACTGHAVAAGGLLLLGCDVRVGPDADVKIGLNEVAIGMVLPKWGQTIATDRLSRGARQRSIVNARLFNGSQAADAGFLDLAVDPADVKASAHAEALVLAELDLGAYAQTVKEFRGPTLATMDEMIAADRLSVA
jgi:enoyl-CoA hydratase